MGEIESELGGNVGDFCHSKVISTSLFTFIVRFKGFGDLGIGIGIGEKVLLPWSFFRN